MSVPEVFSSGFTIAQIGRALKGAEKGEAGVRTQDERPGGQHLDKAQQLDAAGLTTRTAQGARTELRFTGETKLKQLESLSRGDLRKPSNSRRRALAQARISGQRWPEVKARTGGFAHRWAEVDLAATVRREDLKEPNSKLLEKSKVARTP